MRKFENLDSKSPKNKFLKFIYGRIIYYQTFQIYNRQYDKIREGEIDKLVETACKRLSDYDMKELLVFLGYPASVDNRMNLSEEALYLSLS